jgi:hypothetical protein
VAFRTRSHHTTSLAAHNSVPPPRPAPIYVATFNQGGPRRVTSKCEGAEGWARGDVCLFRASVAQVKTAEQRK